MIKTLLNVFSRPAPGIWMPASLLIVLSFSLDAQAVTQTRRDITALQLAVEEMKEDIEDMKKTMDRFPSEEAITLIRENQADLLSQISELLRDVQVLTGRFDESKYYVDKFLATSSANMESLRTRVDSFTSGLSKEEAEALLGKVDRLEGQMELLVQRLTALEEKLAQKAAPDEAPIGAPVSAKVPEPPKERTPEDEYEAALAIYNEGKYGEARHLMQGFIKKHSTHSLAGNALYWIAETYYSEGDYDDAILSYEDLLQDHAEHNKVPSALLKQAFAFLELGDQKAARGILRELIAKYPDTEQAKTAQDKLASLEGASKE